MKCKLCKEEMYKEVDVDSRSYYYFCQNYDCPNGPHWVFLKKDEAIKYAHDLAHLLFKIQDKLDMSNPANKNNIKSMKELLAILTHTKE